MKVGIEVLGPEHEITLSSMEIAALAHRLRGRWDDAEKLQALILETSKKRLSADDPELIISMNNPSSNDVRILTGGMTQKSYKSKYSSLIRRRPS